MHFYILFEVAHTSEVWKFKPSSFIWMFKVVSMVPASTTARLQEEIKEEREEEEEAAREVEFMRELVLEFMREKRRCKSTSSTRWAEVGATSLRLVLVFH
jgi:hypothetical protein